MKKRNKRKKSYFGLRFFISILLTGMVLFSYYCSDFCHDAVYDIIYYTSKKHFNFESVKKIISEQKGYIND